jgi:hypothetical protein
MIEAQEREADPKAPSCFSKTQAVNLNNMRYLEHINGRDPSVYHLRRGLQDTFNGRVGTYGGGDLLTIHGKSWREQPQWKCAGRQWRTFYEIAKFGDKLPTDEKIVEQMDTVKALQKQRERKPLSAYELGLIMDNTGW